MLVAAAASVGPTAVPRTNAIAQDRAVCSRRQLTSRLPMTAQEHNGGGATARQHYSLTFAILALGGVTYSVLQSLVAPALPAIQRDLHVTAAAASWILTAYLIS